MFEPNQSNDRFINRFINRFSVAKSWESHGAYIFGKLRVLTDWKLDNGMQGVRSGSAKYLTQQNFRRNGSNIGKILQFPEFNSQCK